MDQILENHKILESNCLAIMNFASGAYDSLYAPELYVSERARFKKIKGEVDTYLSSILEETSSLACQRFSYTIILYMAYYFEAQIEEETFFSLVSYLLEEKQPKYSHFSPVIYLLQSERTFPPDVIQKISEKVEAEALEEGIERHTKAPYDLGYFFLRREETPENIKEKYLKIYNLIPYTELIESLEEFVNDLNSDLCDQQITDISQIKGNKYLEWDYHYYQVMQEYVRKRNPHKGKVKNHNG